MAESDQNLPVRMPGQHFNFQFIRLPDRHFTFESILLEATDRQIVLTHDLSPSAPLYYGGEEVLGHDYRAVWFLFKDQPFDVARVYRPDGTWTGYYADVLEPVHWTDADPYSLQPLVDLFLDLWITPEGKWQVLDEDELDAAIETRAITADAAARAREVLDGLVRATRSGDFPPAAVRQFGLEGSHAELSERKSTQDTAK